jgi:hypothetical protein
MLPRYILNMLEKHSHDNLHAKHVSRPRHLSVKGHHQASHHYWTAQETPVEVVHRADGTRGHTDHPEESLKLTQGWQLLGVHHQYHQQVHPGARCHACP